MNWIPYKGSPGFQSSINLKPSADMSDTIPSCFSGDRGGLQGKTTQSLVTCTYQTKLAGHCHLVIVTWCKNVMGQGLSITVDEDEDPSIQSMCKVELKPWYFWRKQGSKSFEVDGLRVEVFWDLGSAKFLCGHEPQEGFYVAVVCDEEVVLLLGDMKKEAFRKTKARPSAIEATLISRKEHVFGKKYFNTRTKLDEAGNKAHDISIECHTTGPRDPEMSIKVDGQIVLQVKQLLWKFRGNQTVSANGVILQVFWDIHDWLFNPGLGHALFVFKPVSSSAPRKSIVQDSNNRSPMKFDGCAESAEKSIGVLADYCLLLYAWKLD